MKTVRLPADSLRTFSLFLCHRRLKGREMLDVDADTNQHSSQHQLMEALAVLEKVGEIYSGVQMEKQLFSLPPL